MKTHRLAAVFAGFCLVASATAMAGPGDHDKRGPGQHNGRQTHVDHDRREHARAPQIAFRGHQRQASHHAHQPRWERGGRVPQSYRSQRHVVRDWHRHGLRQPGRGQQWISASGDFLLVAAATGVIMQAVLGR